LCLTSSRFPAMGRRCEIWSMLGLALHMCCIIPSSADGTVETCNADGCSAAEGDSLLMRPRVGKSLLHVAKSTYVGSSQEEDGESQGIDVAEAMRAKQRVLDSMAELAYIKALQSGGTVKRVGRATVLTRDEVVSNQWVFSLPDNCTDGDLKSLTDSLRSSGHLVYVGHPSEGGLSGFVMNGTEAEVHEELQNHNWPCGYPFVEADMALEMIDGELKPFANTSSVLPWGLDRIDDRGGRDKSFEVPAATLKGKGVHVYVLDTGIRTTHSDFSGRAIPTLVSLEGIMTVCDAKNAKCALDEQGHGTHCAGTVGGNTYGVAQEVTLHAVQVLNKKGSGKTASIFAAMDWVIVNSIRPAIMSMSLGGKGRSPGYEAAIATATKSGVAVVVAAGNENDNACRYSPAYVDAAITVGSTVHGKFDYECKEKAQDHAQDHATDTRSGFSNYGKCLDIYAPGSCVVSAGIKGDDSHDTMSGTSMACPHVAGAAALLLAENKTRTPAQVLELLIARSTRDAITDAGIGSPNRLLYVGTDNAVVNPRKPVPTTFAGTCGFETVKDIEGYYCGVWADEPRYDEFEWKRLAGEKDFPYPYTGAGKPFAGKFYLQSPGYEYNLKPDEKGILTSRSLLVAQDAKYMSFAYHMFQESYSTNKKGKLHVEVESIPEEGKRCTEVLWEKTGAQGKGWQHAFIDISGFAGKKCTFRFVSDLGPVEEAMGLAKSIDDVSFDAIPTTTTTTTATTTKPGSAKFVRLTKTGQTCKGENLNDIDNLNDCVAAAAKLGDKQYKVSETDYSFYPKGCRSECHLDSLGYFCNSFNMNEAGKGAKVEGTTTVLCLEPAASSL